MKLRIRSLIWNIRKQKTTNQSCKKEKKNPENKTDDSVRSLWDNFKHIHIMGVPEGEDRGQEIGNLFEKNDRKLP